MGRSEGTRVDITALPFNRFLGLEEAASGSGFLVSLPGEPRYTNHVGTVHAGALIAVAEAGSAAMLGREFTGASGYVPVVRRIGAKFRKPARGRVSARAFVGDGEVERVSTEMRAKGRALIVVSVEVVDEAGFVALTAEVEWFITRVEDGPA